MAESSAVPDTSGTDMDDYDVFLNHRGPDVKSGFIAHLYDALKSIGLNPFLDKKSLVKGDPAFRSIDDALERAKVHVAVVSSRYAESRYSLSELALMIRSGKPVIPVFYDVQPAHLRRVESGPFGDAFEVHKSRESAEQVEEWADALRKLADITGFCFRLSDYNGDEAELKQKVVGAIMSLTCTNEAMRVEQPLVGLEEPVHICVYELEKMSGATGVLGLVGMGGIGKTSLAKEIYNRCVEHKKYQHMSFLKVERSAPSSMEAGSSLLEKLQKQLLWDLLRVQKNTSQSYNYWFQKLSSRGPALVVLDDIDEKSQFDDLILDIGLLAPGSHIIVTSRDHHLLEVVAKKTKFYLHKMTALNNNDSQKLFNWHAFGDEEAPANFQDLAHAISNACGGLPLALKVVGSSLYDKRSDDDRECIWPEAVDALRKDRDVVTALKWSYNCLLEPEKLMFVDIACVFNGYERQAAVEIWESCKQCSSCCGSGTPHTSLRYLIDKSLIVLEGPKKVLTMHGLLQHMGRDIGRIDGSHLWESNSAKAIVIANKGTKKVRALNLANSQKRQFGSKNFAKMPNLHFLVLDGCNVRGNVGSIFKELRWLSWRYMPLDCVPNMLDLSNLVSMDFSHSSQLATLWAESNPHMEVCPNLLTLNLSGCTSITELPYSIGHLSRLKMLYLSDCDNLQQLPRSIGNLTALEQLFLIQCRSLKALPDTFTELSRLKRLHMHGSSVMELPSTIGHLSRLEALGISFATGEQVICIRQLNGLRGIAVYWEFTDELLTLLDSSGTLRNLDRLYVYHCKYITKLPETIGLATNLGILYFENCENLQELPDSIGELQVLRQLQFGRCSRLETLPDSVGALPRLMILVMKWCPSITKLPDSIRQLNSLRFLRVSDCGSLEDLGLSTLLPGLRIWGCTSTRELPGSYLIVHDVHFSDRDLPDYSGLQNDLKTSQGFRLLESNDCGSLGVYTETRDSGRLIVGRLHKLPCSMVTVY